MLIRTTEDPRTTWGLLTSTPALSDEDRARLLALPAGARPAPLAWVCTTRVESRSHFDRDLQDSVSHDYTIVTGWREQPDPRIHVAGALSFHGIEDITSDVLAAFPGPDRLGTSLTALTLEAHTLAPTTLERIGRAHPFTDLSIWAVRWSPAARASGVRELAAFPRLLGLELHTAWLDSDDLAALASAPFLPTLEDLTLTGSPLDESAAAGLFDRLGSLAHLDLRDARLGPRALARLPTKLTRARRLQLSGNALGDELLRALLDGGALDHVEDLWIQRCDLGDASAHALAEAALPALRGLWIDSNRITDEGLAAIVRAPLFARLEGASLHQRALSARSHALLAGHPLEAALHQTARRPGVGALWFLGR